MNIKEMLADDLSRKNYDLLQEYKNTQHYAPIATMSLLAYEKKNGISFVDLLKKEERKKVLFGCGAIAKELLLFLREIGFDFDFYTSNGENASMFEGVPLLSLEELKKTPQDYSFFIGTSIPTYIQEISTQLQELGVDSSQIRFTCGDMGRQYFDMAEFPFGKEEIFVDAGCFNGDDVKAFATATQGVYDKIYAFEPDKTNFQKCQTLLADLPHVQIENCGLWEEKGNLSFTTLATGSSHVTEEEGDTVALVALDELLKGEKITYLKMDIEGAELSALKGAKESIQTHRPKLAICVYHKLDDIEKIPEYIASLVPDYRFYLRHYSLGQLESVLYAI